MKKSKQIAFCGMLSALQLVLLLLGSVIWVFMYCAPLFCGLIMIIIRDSISKKFCFVSYAAVSIIGILSAPDKECIVMYIAFFGYYTAIRDNLQKLNKPLRIIVKLLLYNSTIALSQLALVYIFGIPLDNELGKWGIPLFFVSMNFIFFFYEKLLERIALIYEKKYKNRVDRLLK
ncbi:MAG: hypothetical protein IJS03_03545 [Eubacterium sp.]|nr:hypothetical protein [Eubacterium sp.]